MADPVTVLAHQGWDEVLMFAVPVIVLYLGIRWWDNRQQQEDDRDDGDLREGRGGSHGGDAG